ncbi:MAG: hypothetical protein CMD52_03040 [Gammaproteobacteria bacterium]|nr:hypothetical protein [Gammaproteobacteria bacterium]|tara:strand:+ start:2257 stop:2982 length:726 start_codon:yes stop_codon:yes gene_type:complete
MRGNNRILIGIPLYNEYQNLKRLIADIQYWPSLSRYAVVFVDDGSTDNSASLVLNKKYKLIRSHNNQGYGHCVKLICEYASNEGFDTFIVFPGDYQRTFDDLDKLANAMINYDLIIGSKLRNKNIPLQRKLGNYIFSCFISIIFLVRPIDVLSGFKMYRTASVKKWFDMLPDRYDFDLCLIYVALCKKLNIKKISVGANYKNQTSKMNHSVVIMGSILLWKFFKFVLFYKFGNKKANKRDQ